MAEYTRCVSSGSHMGLTAHIVTGVLLGLLFLPTGAWFAAFAVVMIAACRWWLYDRLICLGGERCAIGTLLTVEEPNSAIDLLVGFESLDKDYSINLLLPPTPIGVTQEQARATATQGELITHQSAVRNIPLRYAGTSVTVDSHGESVPTACLHAEFEGRSVQTLLEGLSVALAVGAAAAAVCWIPIVGWILCLILNIAAGAIAFAALAAAAEDHGAPPAALRAFHPPGNEDADILLVRGEWVFDDGHGGNPGWNEIHPIRHCQKLPFLPKSREEIDAWCRGAMAAASTSTRAEQQRPEHQWAIHPLIDGCAPRRVPEIR